MLQLRYENVRDLKTAAEVVANAREIQRMRKATRLPLSPPPKLVALDLPPAPPPPPPPEPPTISVTPPTCPPPPDDPVPPRKQIYAFEVRNLVAERYGLTIEELISHNRSHCYVRPRHIAIYLMMHLTGMSSPRIGKLLGGRDHSTIICAMQNMRRRLGTDEHLAAEVEDLTRTIEARRT